MRLRRRGTLLAPPSPRCRPHTAPSAPPSPEYLRDGAFRGSNLRRQWCPSQAPMPLATLKALLSTPAWMRHANESPCALDSPSSRSPTYAEPGIPRGRHTTSWHSLAETRSLSSRSLHVPEVCVGTRARARRGLLRYCFPLGPSVRHVTFAFSDCSVLHRLRIDAPSLAFPIVHHPCPHPNTEQKARPVTASSFVLPMSEPRLGSPLRAFASPNLSNSNSAVNLFDLATGKGMGLGMQESFPGRFASATSPHTSPARSHSPSSFTTSARHEGRRLHF